MPVEAGVDQHDPGDGLEIQGSGSARGRDSFQAFVPRQGGRHDLAKNPVRAHDHHRNGRLLEKGDMVRPERPAMNRGDQKRFTFLLESRAAHRCLRSRIQPCSTA